jgi:hypothetical protein
LGNWSPLPRSAVGGLEPLLGGHVGELGGDAGAVGGDEVDVAFVAVVVIVALIEQ